MGFDLYKFANKSANRKLSNVSVNDDGTLGTEYYTPRTPLNNTAPATPDQHNYNAFDQLGKQYATLKYNQIRNNNPNYFDPYGSGASVAAPQVASKGLGLAGATTRQGDVVTTPGRQLAAVNRDKNGNITSEIFTQGPGPIDHGEYVEPGSKSTDPIVTSANRRLAAVNRDKDGNITSEIFQKRKVIDHGEYVEPGSAKKANVPGKSTKTKVRTTTSTKRPMARKPGPNKPGPAKGSKNVKRVQPRAQPSMNPFSKNFSWSALGLDNAQVRKNDAKRFGTPQKNTARSKALRAAALKNIDLF